MAGGLSKMHFLYKKCTKCGIVKMFNEFSRHKLGAMKLRPYCKKCSYSMGLEYMNRPDVRKHRSKMTKIRHIKNRDIENKKYVERCNNDPLFKLRSLIKACLLTKFKKGNFKKKSRATEIIKCSYEDFIIYLNDNKRGLKFGDANLHLDHIIPVSLAETEEELIALNHYKNFRLLPASENIRKGDKLPSIFELQPGIPDLAFQIYMRNV